MTKPIIQIGTEVREMTDAEFAQYEIDQAAEVARIAAEEEAKAAEEAAKAKLTALGLTIEDLQALGL
jgi:hypothetical protein